MLAVLAVGGSVNAARLRAASPQRRSTSARAFLIAIGTILALTALFAGLGAPFLDLVDVSEPGARIAAGFGLLAVGLRDLLAPPPSPAPSLPGPWAGLIPMAFPVGFTPATAAIAMAAGADLGVIVTLGATAPALAVVLAIGLAPIPAGWLASLRHLTALFAVVVAALIAVDGVRSI